MIGRRGGRKISDTASPGHLVRKGIYASGEISRALGVSPRTVAKWCDTGRLPCYRLPGRTDRRIALADLEKFLEENALPAVVAPSRRNVLLVSPDAILFARLKDAFAEYGVLVVIAPNLFAAGELVAAGAYELLIVDYAYHGLEAGEVVIRASERMWPDATVVVVVSEDRKAEEISGVWRVIQKPVDALALARVVMEDNE